MKGGGLLQMDLGGGDLRIGSDFAMHRESRGCVLSLWSRRARRGDAWPQRQPADHDVRGRLRPGAARGGVVAVAQPAARGVRWRDRRAGALLVTGRYPWLGYKATDCTTVWGVAGYRSGACCQMPETGPAARVGPVDGDGGGGTCGEPVGAGSGLELAFKAGWRCGSARSSSAFR